jgi:hypothetical protein
VVTHHVTSYCLVAALILITLVTLLATGRRPAAWPAVFALVSAAAAAAWLVLVAPGTVGYLRPTADGLLRGVGDLFSTARSVGPSVKAGPFDDHVLSILATLALGVLLPAGWWQVWRRHRRQPWVVAMAIGSVGWYGLVAVRLVVADGSELAGRASTFAFIPAAFIAALAVAHLRGGSPRWWARAIAGAVSAAVLLLMFDALANGWPPYWERLPGPYQVAGFERSVDPENVAAARWSLAALGPGQRFAADFGNYNILGSYGNQDPVREVAFLYTSPWFGPADAAQVQAESIRFLLVDHRLSQALPVTRQYFPDDSGAVDTSPIPAADLGKYDHIPGVNRLYDSGDIVIYDLGAQLHAH